LAEVLGATLKSISIGRHGAGLLWIDEAMDVGFDPVGLEERHVKAGIGNSHARMVAVEIYLPRGARAEYALLGMRYEPAPRDDLLVRVLIGETLGSTYDQSLAGQVDEVRLGLPADYVSSVLEATCNEADGCLDPGVLLVDRAAHGLVGSNADLFERLARVLVGILIDPRFPEERLRKAF
jgi:hypothetical protein